MYIVKLSIIEQSGFALRHVTSPKKLVPPENKGSTPGTSV